ncbi:SH3 domain-containing protein [bacterium]|nr:SH3 domain-containing protein [bacterium]
MNRSQLSLFVVVLLSAFVFSGCYVNEQGAVVIGTPPTAGDDVTSPPADDATPEAVEEAGPVTMSGTVNTRSLRVRQGPTVDTPIVAGLRAGTEISITGRTADGAWLQIEVPDVGGNGWVSSEFVLAGGDIATLNLADGSVEDTMTSEPAATPAPTEEPTATAVPAQAQIDLVQTASAISDFSTLVTAVDVAGLVEVLSGDGPFTVFAPTNDAFNALPAGALDALLTDPQGALSQVLLFHVVSGRVNAADISDGLTVETAQGEELVFAVDGDSVTVNGVNITLTDVEASNGVIHVIDAVLVPDAVDISAAIAAPATSTPEAAAEATATPAAEEEATATPEPEAEATRAPLAVGAPIRLNVTDLLATVNTGSPQSLRVREAPSADADIVWGARNGEYYVATERSADGVWVGLAIPELGGVGWVSSEFVTITEDLTLIPTLGSVTVATSDGARLRVRSAPSAEAELKEFLEGGETYEVVAVSEDGAWALINIPQVPGPSWIATEFVTIGAPVQ